MRVAAVKNKSVWSNLRFLFMGAAVIFLINNYFGFDNALTTGDLPRWQMLMHLHSGSIGWITLSAVGFAVWVLTGDRTVDAAYESRVRLLTQGATIVFGLYVLTFGIAFSNLDGPLAILLPLFGAAAVLTLWISAIFALSQLSKQSTLTTVHILASGALLVAAIGATVGMLLGLERVIGEFLPLPPGDRVGAHAGMMDTYLFLVAAAVIEWFSSDRAGERWGYLGLVQGLGWAIGATIVPIAFFTNSIETLLPLFGLMLIIGMVLFIYRVAIGTLRKGPGNGGRQTWIFFGTIWLIIYLVMFLYAVMGTGGDFSLLPTWFFAVFAHAGFVGMMTNLLMALQFTRSDSARNVLPWGENVALWTINGGMLLFFALKITMDIRLGAIVMGIGVVLGVVTAFMRLRAAE